MACAYCFYSEKASLFPGPKRRRMSEELLDILIKQVMSQSDRQISFGWQGGEPALMGLDFFQKAVQLQERHHKGQVIGNGLQTNGILLDNEWAKFLHRRKFLVGLSIDGPEHVHDHYRFMKNGKGSWRKVRDSAKLLLDHGVEVNALTVMNDYSARFPEEIYEFHKELGLFHMQFIPCVETDPVNPEKAASFSVPPAKLGKFLCATFDLWLSDFKDDVPTTSIRFFDSVFYHYVELPPPECTLFDECGIYVAVEHNGDVYSCDFFVEPEWKLGNIRHDLLIELLNSPKQVAFGKMKSNLAAECKKCEWLHYCRGGCTKDRILKSKGKKLDYLCSAYKIFFEHAHPHLQVIADKWKVDHGMTDEPQRESASKTRPRRNDPCPCGSGLKYKKCCGK